MDKRDADDTSQEDQRGVAHDDSDGYDHLPPANRHWRIFFVIVGMAVFYLIYTW